MSIRDLLGDMGLEFDSGDCDWGWTPVINRKLTLSMHRDHDFPPQALLFQEIGFPIGGGRFSNCGIVCYNDKLQCYTHLSLALYAAHEWHNVEWEEIDEWEGTNKEYLQLINSKRPLDDLLTIAGEEES